jgi:hypothetical protein
MFFRKLGNGGEIGIQLDQLGGKMARRASKPAGKARRPEKFTWLDIGFKNNDQLKTNTSLHNCTVHIY